MITDVLLTPRVVDERHVEGRSVVAIDILRACSTIVVALSNGASAVLPVSDLEAATRLAQNMDADRYLLGGERHGVKIDGFHLGNSPFEYTSETVSGRTVIFKTTNGTDAILKGLGADHVLIGSFLNAPAIVQYLLDAGRDISIICAGWRGLISYEDLICAGLILDGILQHTSTRASSDASRIAHLLYHETRDKLGAALADSDHGRRLAKLGLSEDVEFCSRLGTYDIVPEFMDQATGVTITNSDDS